MIVQSRLCGVTIVLLAYLFYLTSCVYIYSVPSTQLQVVDERTLVSQPLICVTLYGGKPTYDIAGESWSPTIFNRDYFLTAQEGWVTIPAAQSGEITFQKVSCDVIIQSPGYMPAKYNCDRFIWLSKAAKRPLIVKLKPIVDLDMMHDQARGRTTPTIRDPKGTYESSTYFMSVYEFFLSNWESFCPPARPQQWDTYGWCVDDYLGLTFPKGAYGRDFTEEQSQELKVRACLFLKSELAKHDLIRSELLQTIAKVEPRYKKCLPEATAAGAP